MAGASTDVWHAALSGQAALIWAAFWLGIGFGFNRLWALQQWPSHHIWTVVAVGLLLLMLLGWWRRDAVQRRQD
ncbi:hypothetical protein SAMN05443662_0374 [Sulfurivirga caldicuralii]|uniref:Uncharacterized protein n=1 Tax=Sulfurivirga caldicuralii TaxID=364032 RepID=A0A1N6DRW5_9GAMM|nr:hypothetical protein [Sulfurivirga caldicuralii]SIN73529.1 hypothetical protein SAMN05443662_0374 [Sulfurivirga caldicuralii]